MEKGKRMRRSGKPLAEIKIAKERIDILFKEAEKMVKKNIKEGSVNIVMLICTLG